jgi:hypothetical protein
MSVPAQNGIHIPNRPTHYLVTTVTELSRIPYTKLTFKTFTCRI